MATDLPTLKQKRGRARGTISRLKNYIQTLPEGTDAIDVESRFTNLKDALRDFCEYDDQIAMHPNEESHIEAVEEIFYATQAAFHRHLNPTRNNNESFQQQQQHAPLDETLSLLASQQQNLIEALHDRAPIASELRMPVLTIPQFNGSYATWPSFQDLYKSIVHTNTKLSKIQKFQYLKGLLIGDAADQIRHILVTEDNYDVAWEKLVDRYDKKKQIINNYIKTFIEQPQLNFASAIQLRRLADTSDEIIRGLGTVGPDAQKRDPWLIYILLQKTDDYTRQLWAIKASEKKFHTFDDFIKFINERCDALEAYAEHNLFSDSNNIQQQQNTMQTQSTNRFGHEARNPFGNPHGTKQQQNTMHSQTSSRCPKCSGMHPLFKCHLFKTLPVSERRQLVLRAKLCFNCLHDGHQTSSCNSTFRCHYCNEKHHSALHQHDQIRSYYTDTAEASASSDSHSNMNQVPPQNQCQNQSQPQSYSASNITKSSWSTLLPTAIVYVQDDQGCSRAFRALLDSGSMVSFVSESCVQSLGLNRKHDRSPICGLSAVEVAVTKGEVTLQLNTSSGVINLSALILQKVTSSLPLVDISPKPWPWIHEHKLADPLFYKSQNIDILIGADQFFNVLKNGQIKYSVQEPILQNTIFGWIVAGPHYQPNNHLGNPNSFQVTVGCDIDKALTKFWEVEEISNTKSQYTDEEMHCETHFKTHLRINSDGRFIVRLPFTKSPQCLGNSRRTAISCLLSMERRLVNNPDLYQQYRTFMNEYISMGHMRKIPQSDVNIEDSQGFYLPHHSVLKPSSTTTKVRVVFNASRKTSSNVSLNDILGVGPTIQRDLFSILINFRQYRIPASADVTKMYRQIQVDSQDWNYQRIVWRDDSSKKIQDYWLTTVTYGTSSAPFLATRALFQIADDCRSTHPIISHIIRNNFYVDDLLTGADNADEATHIRELLEKVLEERGFELRKWKSSSKEFINKVDPDKREEQCIDFDSEPTKLLGLYWNPDGDYFSFHSSLSNISSITKRTILSESAKIFDPLGLLSPATIALKILFQQLWVEQPNGSKLNWDDIVPEKLAERWRIFTKEFKFFKNIKVDRWIHTTNLRDCEFHGFCDASEAAYSAVVYCRTEHQGNVHVRIVAAKTKVAPLKQQSLPRLELCGALLLAKLFESIRKALNEEKQQITAWTDSQIVLSWLNSQPRRWSTFVGNRTAAVLNICQADWWRYVSSYDNPADIASRGASPKMLESSSIWWQGPTWLNQSKLQWPSQQPSSSYQTKTEEKRINVQAFHSTESESVLEKILMTSSSFEKITTMVAYWLRLRSILQFKVIQRKTDVTKTLVSFSLLSKDEIKTATISFLRWVQRVEFSEELKHLKLSTSVKGSSKLSPLFPFFDGDGLLRVGGRLHNSSCNYDAQHPVILPKKHQITSILINQYHIRYLHPGPTLLLSIMRQRYWIIGGRSTICFYIPKCMNCFRPKSIKQQQLMGSLPDQRVHPSRPFMHCGIDYAGPIKTRLNNGRGRGAKTSKGYIALYVCFSTKAIHVEMVSELITVAFNASFKRFISRRGIPANIYSDNATNFIGAKRKLSELYKMALSTDFNNTGTPITTLPEKSFVDINPQRLNRWQQIQRMVQSYWKQWSRDYLQELNQCPKWRREHKNVAVDDLVLIHEDNLPPSSWLLGRITAVHPGKDGIVRAVTLRTKLGELKRPIVKISKLPIN